MLGGHFALLLLASAGRAAVALKRGHLEPEILWLANNKERAGVVVLPSGLQYRVLESGPADGVHSRSGAA